MLTLALPNGTHMDFENAEALELALQRMREAQTDCGPRLK